LEYSIGARGIAVGGITAVHWEIIGDSAGFFGHMPPLYINIIES